MLIKTKFIFHNVKRYSTKLKLRLEESFDDLLNKKEVKHRKHPGIIERAAISLPEQIISAMRIILNDVPVKTRLIAESKHFKDQLHGRHVPIEEKEKERIFNEIQENLLSKYRTEDLSITDIEELNKKNRPKSMRILNQELSMWRAIHYDKQKSLLYMITRSSENYAVLYSIFREIRNRNDNFKPRTVLDFGSGIGTVMWAINQNWPKKVHEFMNVDISTDISDLSEKIMKIVNPKVRGIFNRQFLPISMKPDFDIVVSAYALIELPNVETRLQTVMKLWKKTTKYLVIVEEGTNAGFSLVNEARDFILHICNSEKTQEIVHVFAPCSHDLPCPKLKTGNIPCNFEVHYTRLPIIGSAIISRERYSYIVLEKGTHPLPENRWPRLVESTMKRGKHAICQLCMNHGNLERIVFTASKHGRNLYRCARSSKWGDRLPVTCKFEESNDVETESCKNDNQEISDESEDEEELCEIEGESSTVLSKNV